MKTPLNRRKSDALPPFSPVFLRSPDPAPIITPMTVGIAAICDGGKAIVMAADRLITVGEAQLVTEIEHPKIQKLLPNVWLTITGPVQQYEFAMEHYKDSDWLVRGTSVHVIARRLRLACHRIRTRMVESRYTQAHLGMTYREFVRHCADSQVINTIVADVYNKATNHSFDLIMMIAGIDDRGPHLYLVNDLGVNSFKAMGFAAIGIGAASATVSLARDEKCYYSRSVAETMYRVYEAKRACEQTALVSKSTDMVVIRESEPLVVSPAQIDVLRCIYESRMQKHLSASEIASIEGGFSPLTQQPPSTRDSSTHESPDQPPSPESAP
jgi:20S proteasome alpha/beta subunit